MSKLLATKPGNVFLGGDDDSNSGKTLELEEIKKTGAVFIASSENEDVIGTGADFVRAFDYANDQIGYVTKLSGGVRKIIVYDIPNDKFIHNEEMPALPAPSIDAFFVNQNLFIAVNYAQTHEWRVYKYTFPALALVTSYDYISLSENGTVETNLDKIFLWDDHDFKRLDDSLSVEVTVGATGDTARPLAADTSYTYRKKNKVGDTLPYEIERRTLSYTGATALFTYGAPFNYRITADDGDLYMSSKIDNTIRVYDSAGTLEHTFSGPLPFSAMTPIGLTQNYIVVLKTPSVIGSLAIYDRSYNLVRVL